MYIRYYMRGMRGKLLRVSRGKKRVSRASMPPTHGSLNDDAPRADCALLSRFSHFDSRRMALLLSSQSIRICRTQIFAAYNIVLEF